MRDMAGRTIRQLIDFIEKPHPSGPTMAIDLATRKYTYLDVVRPTCPIRDLRQPQEGGSFAPHIDHKGPIRRCAKADLESAKWDAPIFGNLSCL
jgi:hypothetical protein